MKGHLHQDASCHSSGCARTLTVGLTGRGMTLGCKQKLAVETDRARAGHLEHLQLAQREAACQSQPPSWRVLRLCRPHPWQGTISLLAGTRLLSYWSETEERAQICSSGPAGHGKSLAATKAADKRLSERGLMGRQRGLEQKHWRLRHVRKGPHSSWKPLRKVCPATCQAVAKTRKLMGTRGGGEAGGDTAR